VHAAVDIACRSRRSPRRYRADRVNIHSWRTLRKVNPAATGLVIGEPSPRQREVALELFLPGKNYDFHRRPAPVVGRTHDQRGKPILVPPRGWLHLRCARWRSVADARFRRVDHSAENGSRSLSARSWLPWLCADVRHSRLLRSARASFSGGLPAVLADHRFWAAATRTIFQHVLPRVTARNTGRSEVSVIGGDRSPGCV